MWVVASLLMGLRIGPVFAFAPSFSLVRLPRTFRMLLALGLSATLVSGNLAQARLPDLALGTLVMSAIRELALGVTIALAFQLTFAALYMAGRTVDVQAGFGLAMLIDPTSKVQAPLIGSLFAYAAGALFFAANGHIDLLRLLMASLDAVPLGTWTMAGSLDRLLIFISAVFLTGFGVAGAAVLTMFLIDMMIALLSRTVPQMNVLVMGFQVKTIALMLVLPVCFGLGGALMVRMLRITLEALPGLI